MARKTVKLSRGLGPEQLAKKAAREARLVEIGEAIREGRAYLDTFQGRKKVKTYDDNSGWAVTNDGGGWLNDQSFMVCLESIRIDPRA